MLLILNLLISAGIRAIDALFSALIRVLSRSYALP